MDELLKYAILYSDNTAYYMLNQRYAFDGFVDYAASLGIETDLRLPKPRFGVSLGSGCRPLLRGYLPLYRGRVGGGGRCSTIT